MGLIQGEATAAVGGVGATVASSLALAGAAQAADPPGVCETMAGGGAAKVELCMFHEHNKTKVTRVWFVARLAGASAGGTLYPQAWGTYRDGVRKGFQPVVKIFLDSSHSHSVDLCGGSSYRVYSPGDVFSSSFTTPCRDWPADGTGRMYFSATRYHADGRFAEYYRESDSFQVK